MKHPLISVIITVYNMEKYIEDCIASVISQSFSDIEIIIIDDGSTDNSGYICDKYSKTDTRIRVFHHGNKGLANARKEGINESKGEYIVFIDADDWIDLDTFKEYVSIIERFKPSIIVDGLIKEYSSRSVSTNNIIPRGYYTRKDIEDRIFPYMIYTGNFYEKGIESFICSKAVKREIIIKVADSINADIDFTEGVVWLYSVLLISDSAVLIDGNHYHYRMRNNSMAMESKDELKSLINVYKTLAHNISANDVCKESLFNQLDFLMMYSLIWKRLDLFNKNDESVVWPYLELKKNDRIVIYGAWRYGRKLYEYLKSRKFGNIIMVVDRNAEQCEIEGIKVEHPEKLREIEYDYILLGSEIFSVIRSMKNQLLSMGITENILTVSGERVDTSLLPEEFKCIRARYE